jgi:hypothetical protein
MIMRDVDGNIHIINRTDCKNDIVYYEKIYKIKLGYTKKFKSIVVNIPKNDKNDKNM